MKLSDDFWTHPKIMAVGDSGAGLYARMLSYCGCYLTDGLIPGHTLPMLVGANKRGYTVLVEHGLVEELESGSVVIHDYLDYQKSRSEWDKERARAKANGSKGGRPRSNGGRAS